jgi:hypothetical protein
MAETPKSDKSEIADAAQLFGDAPTDPPPARAQKPGQKSGEIGGYDLEEGEPVTEEATPLPLPIPEARPKSEAAARRAAMPSLDADATVDQVWSRSAEWGPSVVLLALVGVFVILLVYVTSSDLSLAFVLLLLGSAGMLVLSYPIVITLERPVRITPEQAVNDFYGALSHHMPHYRRMWLLLSSAGRVSTSYASFEGFKAYWKKRLKQLRGERASKFTPLVFKVDEFKSEKSAGQSALDAKFTVRVFLRGHQDEGPIDTIRVDSTFVRGPDKMWYLNRGTLPGARVGT